MGDLGWGGNRLGQVIWLERNLCWAESLPFPPTVISALQDLSYRASITLSADRSPSLCAVLNPSSIIPTASNPSLCSPSPPFLSVFTLPLSHQAFLHSLSSNRELERRVCELGGDLTDGIVQLFHSTGWLEAGLSLVPGALDFLFRVTSFRREACQVPGASTIPSAQGWLSVRLSCVPTCSHSGWQ